MNTDKLPLTAYATHPTTGAVIMVRRGQQGYWPVTTDVSHETAERPTRHHAAAGGGDAARLDVRLGLPGRRPGHDHRGGRHHHTGAASPAEGVVRAAGDLFGVTAAPPPRRAQPTQNADGNYEFVTVGQARDWIDQRGWIPRHGGGYEDGARRARIVSQQSRTSDQTVAVVIIDAGGTR